MLKNKIFNEKEAKIIYWSFKNQNLNFLFFLHFRFGYFVMKQPSFLDYTDEGGPTDNCSPLMSAGRGPFRSTKDFIKKYGLRLVAATFLIIDSSQVRFPYKTQKLYCLKRLKQEFAT